jgi:hypothetical protein
MELASKDLESYVILASSLTLNSPSKITLAPLYVLRLGPWDSLYVMGENHRRELNDVETLKLLYVTYVRSQLEYPSLVWSPMYNVYISELEGVQRRFLKSALYLTEGTYPQRGCPKEILLNKVGLTSLITRRTEHSVLFLFKVLHVVQECISLLQQISLKVPRRNARSSNTFYLSTSRTNVLINSPLNFMLRSYTSIENENDIFGCTLGHIKTYFQSLQV